jgi:ATP-dependent DNA ligase
MVFDLLAVDGVDFAASAVAERRAVLDTVAAGCRPPLQVLPFTDDRFPWWCEQVVLADGSG